MSDYVYSSLHQPMATATTSNSTNNKWKRKLILRHHRSHWDNLLRGTIPIFVAACISRAVSTILDTVSGSGNIGLNIAINVVYALCIAHVVGYLVALRVPESHKLVDYYADLANDNASFAWSTSLTLVILNWLYNSEDVLIAILAWALLLFLVCCIIYVASYLQIAVIKPAPEIQIRLRNFESESFALAVAYSLTVIIAVSIYRNASTNYLSDTDDLNSTNDDGKDFSGASWYYLLYLMFITLLMVVYQRHLGYRKRRKDAQLEQQACRQDDEAARNTYIDEENDTTDLPMSMFVDEDSEEEEEDVRNSAVSTLWDWLCPWDASSHCWKTFRAFYFTSIGYLVSSGWTVWSLLTFEKIFSFYGGDVFGLLIYALLATLVVSMMMTAMTVRRDMREIRQKSESDQAFPLEMFQRFIESSSTQHRISQHNAIMYIAFGRLTVGWAWSEFFTETIGILVPADNSSRVGLLIAAKSLFAVLAFVGGRYAERYLHHAAAERRTAVEAKSQLSREGNLSSPLL